MFCSRCGKENPNSNHFCSSCGQPLPTHDPDPTPPPIPQYQAPTPNPAYLQPVPAESAFSLYIGCFKKYAQFQGRARRSEFWYFCLFHYLVSLALMLPVIFGIIRSSARSIGNPIFIILLVIYIVASIIPSLAVLSRRLHDTGRSGKWVILFVIFGAIPLINLVVIIVQFVFTVQDSQPKTNQYGPSLKYPDPFLQVSP